MYIRLTDISNGQPVPLITTLCSRPDAELEIALCELTYYHSWMNVSAELENNRVSNGDETTVIRDGYYNNCELNEKVFQPLGAELELNAATGRLQLSVSKQKHLVLNRGLAKFLGFTQLRFQPGSYIADKAHNLSIHKVICAHLAEVCTSENLHNGRPSTMIRLIPVGNERCGSGRTESFPYLQFIRLTTNPISQLTLSLKDINGKLLSFDHISATLHLRSK